MSRRERQCKWSLVQCLGFRRLVALAVSSGLILSGSSMARAGGRVDGCGDPNASLARVQARYDEIDDLFARFTQTTESVVLAGASRDAASQSGGEVLLAKPGRMRWTYTEPEPSVVVSDGRVIWIHDVEGRQVTRASVSGGYLAGAALQFLLGEGKLQDSFNVTEASCSKGQVELDLTPRKPASYERIRATIDRSSGLVSETSVHDLFGNRTTLRFSEVELNQSPPDSRFEFEAPEGVDVIDMDIPN